MRYLVLTMASADPGDSDITSFSSQRDLEDFVTELARAGAHKIIIFEKSNATTDFGGGKVWTPEDEIFGKRLRDIGQGVARR